METGTTVAQIDAVLQAAQGGAIVLIGASWCEPCQPLKEYLTALPGYPHVKKIYVDAEAVPDYAERENIDSVPHVLFFRQEAGKPKRIAEISGAKMKEIELNVRCLFDPTLDCPAGVPINDHLAKLLKKDKIMLFITGTPSLPRCGFTGKLMELIHKHGVSYTFFDVWANEDICQGLKNLSGWPTYPQVYINGELIGGLDICTQMDHEGQLAPALQG